MANTNETNMPSEDAATGNGRKSFLCALCDIKCTSYDMMQQHITGRRHKRRLRFEAEQPECAAVLTENKLANVAVVEQEKASDLEKKCDKTLSENKSTVAPMVDGGEKKGDDEVNGNAVNVDMVANTRKRTSKGNQAAAVKKIKKAEKVPVNVERCEICSVTCTNKSMLDSHLNGKKHAARLRKLGNEVAADAATDENTEVDPNQASNVDIDCQEASLFEAKPDASIAGLLKEDNIANDTEEAKLNETLSNGENTISNVE